MNWTASETSSLFSGARTNRLFCRLMLLLCCWLITQCALRPVPRDLATYYNRDIYGIAELETLALERYADVTGENYTSDEELRQSLETVIIPAYKRFADLTVQINPQTEPVRKLHALYREAAALRLQGFRIILLALDSRDPSLVRQANRLLVQAGEPVAQWQANLSELAAQHGLNLDRQQQ